MSDDVQQEQQPAKPASASRWDALVWPRWLPVRARLPLVAQITAAISLMAALTMPGWSEVQPATAPVSSSPVAAQPSTATGAGQTVVVPLAPAVAPDSTISEPSRPAHLNLDVRHNFGAINLSVTVDDDRVLEERLDGSRKRFGAFGKRSEKGFTKTLDLEPGVRVVRVRVRSSEDKFDQTRVERFELGPASVASMRIAVDKGGLSIFADRPAPPQSMLATALPPVQVQVAPAPATSSESAPSAAGELYQALRQMLIAVTGFVASAATGFVVQEFLRNRSKLIGL